MKNNITLICILDNYGKAVAKLLSEKLDMFFADMLDMFEYELIDTDHIKATLGEVDGDEYIKKIQKNVVKNVSKFDNTLVNIQPSVLFDDNNYKVLSSNSYIVYVQISPKYFEARIKKSNDILPKDMKGNVFAECDKKYVKYSDIVVNCSTLKESKAAKKIVSEINKFFRTKSKLNIE